MSFSLTPTAIATACRSAAAAAVTIEVVAQTGSTNADLLARAGSSGAGVADAVVDAARTEPGGIPLVGPTLLVALTQTAGRGRAGRAWQSDTDSLTFSLAWPFPQSMPSLLGLPLAVGVAVAEVLAARRIEVALKWPNDILIDGHKLAGILIETRSTGVGGGRDRDRPLQRRTWAVIGIGINLQASGEDPRMIDGRAIAALPATDRNALLAELLDALTAALQRFEQAGLAPFVARWNGLHAHAGQAVDILDQGTILHSGVARGVDASGRLLLETGTPALPQVVAIVAGDVSLRARHGGAHAAVD